LLLPYSCFFHSPYWHRIQTLNRILAVKDDTSKVNKLTRYSTKFEETDKSKAIDILKIAADVSKKINYPLGIGQAMA
jgi:hypothetical protein